VGGGTIRESRVSMSSLSLEIGKLVMFETADSLSSLFECVDHVPPFILQKQLQVVKSR